MRRLLACALLLSLAARASVRADDAADACASLGFNSALVLCSDCDLLEQTVHDERASARACAARGATRRVPCPDAAARSARRRVQALLRGHRGRRRDGGAHLHNSCTRSRRLETRVNAPHHAHARTRSPSFRLSLTRSARSRPYPELSSFVDSRAAAFPAFSVRYTGAWRSPPTLLLQRTKAAAAADGRPREMRIAVGGWKADALAAYLRDKLRADT